MTTGTGTSQRAREVTGAAKEEGQQLAQSAADSTKQVARTARHEASSVVSEAGSQGRRLAEMARDQVGGQIDTQRRQLADTLRTTGEELRSGQSDEQSKLTSELTRRAADQAGSVADYLERTDATEVLDQVRRFARRRPGTFLLIAAAAGVVTGRVVRSVASAGSSPSSGSHSDRPYSSTVDESFDAATYGPPTSYANDVEPGGSGYVSDVEAGGTAYDRTRRRRRAGREWRQEVRND